MAALQGVSGATRAGLPVSMHLATCLAEGEVPDDHAVPAAGPGETVLVQPCGDSDASKHVVDAIASPVATSQILPRLDSLARARC